MLIEQGHNSYTKLLCIIETDINNWIFIGEKIWVEIREICWQIIML